ncbi:MAG TPA: alanine racemase [Chthoniobacterales bacterium]|nr:alanine racemase [Chthoniobacterales bacterium]
MNSETTYRCWAEIDQNALRHNAAVVRERIGADVELLAVVKANGYGHGMVGVAKALTQDAQLFGVANLEEAVTLRKEVWQPIIVLGPALPEERQPIVDEGFIPSVSAFEEAQAFDRAATHSPVAINFVIDTGMGRMGIPQAEAAALFQKVAALPNLKIHSLSTHLPVSNEDADFTRAELLDFAELVEKLRAEFPGDYKVHALPSAGVLAFSDPPFDIVRAGLMLYGISPFPDFQKLLRPVMTWKTHIALIRDMPAGRGISYGRTFITPRPMRVATLSAGYADGYPRHLSNREAAVLVRGRRCALLGRVTMDLMMIDVSDIGEARVGDEVVLMGRQGDEEISATELAERAGTITWEIVTRIGSRVRRVFV